MKSEICRSRECSVIWYNTGLKGNILPNAGSNPAIPTIVNRAGGVDRKFSYRRFLNSSRLLTPRKDEGEQNEKIYIKNKRAMFCL